MKRLDPNKVSVTFRDGLTPTSPIVGRHYTVTHSDETGEMFVTVGRQYAEDVVQELRDEVRLRWSLKGGIPILHGEVLIDSPTPNGSARIRNAIFMREMSTALQAVRIAEEALLEKYPALEHAKIYIHFQSVNPKYDKVYDFKTLEQYK